MWHYIDIITLSQRYINFVQWKEKKNARKSTWRCASLTYKTCIDLFDHCDRCDHIERCDCIYSSDCITCIDSIDHFDHKDFLGWVVDCLGCLDCFGCIGCIFAVFIEDLKKYVLAVLTLFIGWQL